MRWRRRMLGRRRRKGVEPVRSTGPLQVCLVWKDRRDVSKLRKHREEVLVTLGSGRGERDRRRFDQFRGQVARSV